ncbi:hypothetical protein M445_05650 [Vibrio owensii 47666-1]|uniref:TadE/TadG family type IV pilus assembly protein n=1 Tax=Vibrio owensii TaxID=696485 RepID=UPI0005850688|nr:hypothetical protein [Vibrio owensii]KIF48820.1 hypothetical protein M445_05650 [Vibrio owensii 47666-1]
MKQYESGHAGIMFVLMLPVLWGITAVSLDSSHGIQTKVRLDEAVDQAVIAVSARPVSDSELDDALIEEYVTSYIPYAHNVKPELTLEDCSEDVPNSCTRYKATALADIETWFPGGKTIAGFDEKLSIGGTSKAEKVAVPVNKSVALDVIFVADTSESMAKKDFGGADSRMDALHKVFSKVIARLDDIDKKNDDPDMRSTFGYVPFTDTHYTLKNGNTCVGLEAKIDEKYPFTWDLKWTVDNMFNEKTWCNEPDRYDSPRNFEILPTTDYNSIDVSIIRPRQGGTIPVHSFIRGVQLLKKGKNKDKLLILFTDGEISDRESNDRHIELQRDYQWCDVMRNELSSDGVNLTFVGMTIGDVKDTTWFDLCFGEGNTYENNNLDEFFDSIEDVMTFETSTEIGHYVK